MGLSRMQGTPGYISYFGSSEGKRTRFNCDHYHRFAECCFRNKRVEPCRSPGRCKYHTENTPVTLLEIENQSKVKVTKTSKKPQQKSKKQTRKKKSNQKWEMF